MPEQLQQLTTSTGRHLRNEEMVLNMGPQHPSTHGVFRAAIYYVQPGCPGRICVADLIASMIKTETWPLPTFEAKMQKWQF